MAKGHDFDSVNKFILALQELTKDNTIPSQQITLLLSLYVHGTTNQGDLEELTGVKRSSNSRNISKLGIGEHPVENPGPGLLESFEDLGNRRLKLVRLTAKGQALLDECWNRSFGKSASAQKGVVAA